MKRKIDFIAFFRGIAIAGILAAIIATFNLLPYMAAFALIVFSMFLNGMLAEYEDNLPGGFNNPMSPEEIKIANAQRRKKFLPWRIAIWVAFLAVIALVVWMPK